MMLRKQYHFRPGSGGLQAWDVRRLIELAKELPVIDVVVANICELDEAYWYGEGQVPTCRSIGEHARLIAEADFNYPILLSSDGRVMDGMHCAVKAAMQNLQTIPAKKFECDPAPDYVGVAPEDLPY